MLKTTSLLLFAFTLTHAQNEGGTAKDEKFYHLDFVVKEVADGKVTNSRTYSMIASPKERGQIRVGSRVPVPTSSANQNFTYLDVGVSIDCSQLRELQNQLAFRVSADISSAVKTEQTPLQLPPVIRQNKWDSQVVIPLKKPTLLFSSDDPVTKGKIQLEVTATRIE